VLNELSISGILVWFALNQMMDGSIVEEIVTPVLRAERVDDGLFRSLVPDVY
jgi:hypothetical protein